MILWDLVTNQHYNISTTTNPMATKLARMVTWMTFNHKVKQCSDHVHVVLQSHVTNENHYISTVWVPMATKLGRIVTYLDGLPSIKLPGFLIMWFYEITWQTKTIISPLQQCLWPPNLGGWWLTLMDSHLESHMTLLSRSLAT